MADFALLVRDVPRARHQRSQVYRDTVEEFAASGVSSTLVKLGKRQDAAYSGLREAIADLGYRETLRVSRRGSELYLVRQRGGSSAPEA